MKQRAYRSQLVSRRGGISSSKRTQGTSSPVLTRSFRGDPPTFKQGGGIRSVGSVFILPFLSSFFFPAFFHQTTVLQQGLQSKRAPKKTKRFNASFTRRTFLSYDVRSIMYTRRKSHTAKIRLHLPLLALTKGCGKNEITK